MKKNETTQTTETTVPRETTQPKKERGDSPTYTIKSFGKVIQKMHKAKMITPEEYTTLKHTHETVVKRWISIGLSML